MSGKAHSLMKLLYASVPSAWSAMNPCLLAEVDSRNTGRLGELAAAGCAEGCHCLHTNSSFSSRCYGWSYEREIAGSRKNSKQQLLEVDGSHFVLQGSRELAWHLSRGPHWACLSATRAMLYKTTQDCDCICICVLALCQLQRVRCDAF